MFSFTVVSLPILGMAYLFGGVQLSDLCYLILVLLMAAVQAATAAIVASSLFRSAIASFFTTYALLAALAFGPPICAGILDEMHMLPRIRLFPDLPVREQLYMPFTAFILMIEMIGRGSVSWSTAILSFWPSLLVAVLMIGVSMVNVHLLHADKGLAIAERRTRLRNLLKLLWDP
ncbi:MAG: hypothetical protein KDA85_05560, partial [Planctomycetaceae bacterium]|nr:hypothetical protein [Planctomycetaceae bacterium]